MKHATISDKIEEKADVGHVRRCGVCKVDLKGRFVYVDEVSQSLLGYSDEDLFGKALAGFVEESQRPALARLIEIRSYYESFYESAALTLLHSDGIKQDVTVVFSLNFIAGNPANYQIIFDKRSVSSSSEDTTELNIDFALSASCALECIARFKGKPDWETFSKLLVDLSCAERAIVYEIDGKKLNALAGYSPNLTSSDTLNSAPKTKGIHRRIAKTGDIYDFTREDAVRKAIETGGNAPDEFLSRLEMADGRAFLVRLCFDSENLPENPDKRISAVVSVLEIATCLMTKKHNQSRGSSFEKQATEVVTSNLPACEKLMKVIEELSPGFSAEWVKKSSL